MLMREIYVSGHGGRVWCGVVGKSKARTPLLCIPGGPGLPHDYFESLLPLAEERPLIFYDPLGSGRSERPAGYTWSLERFSEEVVALVTAMELESLHLLSHSMGSLTLLGALDRAAPRLRSVVLASPVIDVPAYVEEVRRRVVRMTPDFEAVMRAEQDPTQRKTLAYGQLLQEFTEQHVCRLPKRPECLSRSFAAINRVAHHQVKGGGLFYLTPAATLDLSPRLEALSMPTLITCGEDDLITPEMCRGFQRRAPRCAVAVFAGCTHMPHLEDPPRFVERLARFLDGADRGELV